MNQTNKTNQKKIRTYSELIQFATFEDRYNYLRLFGTVAGETFGFDRYLNQEFYKSKEWKRVRNEVIARDNGCDLGVLGREISGNIYIHHMNPLSVEDIESASDYLLNPEYLISVSLETHNAIHYGNKKQIKRNNVIIRTPNDTCPWKQ